jgi:hypothetical protein
VFLDGSNGVLCVSSVTPLAMINSYSAYPPSQLVIEQLR